MLFIVVKGGQGFGRSSMGAVQHAPKGTEAGESCVIPDAPTTTTVATTLTTQVDDRAWAGNYPPSLFMFPGILPEKTTRITTTSTRTRMKTTMTEIFTTRRMTARRRRRRWVFSWGLGTLEALLRTSKFPSGLLATICGLETLIWNYAPHTFLFQKVKKTYFRKLIYVLSKKCNCLSDWTMFDNSFKNYWICSKCQLQSYNNTYLFFMFLHLKIYW